MTISILIETDGKDVFDEFVCNNSNLEEVACVLLRLKQIEKVLIEKDFEDKFKVDLKND